MRGEGEAIVCTHLGTGAFQCPNPHESPQVCGTPSRVLERISLDKSNPNVMLNDITTIDAALTRPWTVIKKYGRRPQEKPEWAEENCAEGNGHVVIQGQGYFLAADGNLMPTSKDQPTPDLRFFKQGPR